MDVKFYYTTKGSLPSLPVVNGQIIALKDETGYYYDMNNKRHRVNSIECVDTRPEVGVDGIIYISKSPEGVFTWDVANNVWSSVLTVEVHEAPSDGRTYGRRNGGWSMMRWIVEVDSDQSIPAATVNTIISGLLGAATNASLKVVGKVDMGVALAVTTSQANQAFFLDIADMIPSATSKGINLKATNATDSIRVSGRIANAVSVSGSGRVDLVDCLILANVTCAGPASLKISSCDIGNYIIACSSTSSTKAGFNMVGCHMNGGQINMESDAYFYNMLADNVLAGTAVTRGGTTVDGLYNNEGA